MVEPSKAVAEQLTEESRLNALIQENLAKVKIPISHCPHSSIDPFS
jgi:hypothetical protein